MQKSSTNSYVVKTRLIVNKEQYCKLNTLMGIYCHIQNVVIKHAINMIKNLERDCTYQKLKGHKMSAEEKAIARSLLIKYKITKTDFEKYSRLQNKIITDKNGKSIPYSAITQSITNRVVKAVDSYLFKNGKELHFKKRREFKGFENKQFNSGIKYENRFVFIRDLKIPVYFRKSDTFLFNALRNDRIKYCRISRKWHKHRYRYYITFVMEGCSAIHCPTKNGKIGIDIGPSTIAVDSEADTFIEELGAGVLNIEHKLFILNRKLDRQRRANNPQNYNDDGTIKRNTKSFRRRWIKSHRMRKTEHAIKDLYQKRKNQLEYKHNLLAKRILSLGKEIIVEDMNWAALAKKAKKTEKSEKTGKFKKKKRFGKSIVNHAPSKLISLLEIKAANCGASVTRVDCFETKATQFDHTTGEFVKHPLKERNVSIGKDKIQRDLHSAFNLRYVMIFKEKEKVRYEYDVNKMTEDYKSFKQRHNECMNHIKQLKKEGIYIPSSI